eukprot:scaffold3767_cov242-Prasinococcus_capsulatus_cf.AAC.13
MRSLSWATLPRLKPVPLSERLSAVCRIQGPTRNHTLRCCPCPGTRFSEGSNAPMGLATVQSGHSVPSYRIGTSSRPDRSMGSYAQGHTVPTSIPSTLGIRAGQTCTHAKDRQDTKSL